VVTGTLSGDAVVGGANLGTAEGSSHHDSSRAVQAG
jgi:hypothetical protein